MVADKFDQDQKVYDFLSDDAPQKPPRQPASKKRRILIAGLVGLGLLIVFWILFSIIFSGGQKTTELLVKVAQRQTELVRLGEMGRRYAESDTISAFATNTKLSVQSSQAPVDQMLVERERPLPTEERRALQRDEIDSQLESALRAGEFDSAFEEVLTNQLKAYQEDLNAAHSALSSERDRQVLEEAYEAVRILLESKRLSRK